MSPSPQKVEFKPVRQKFSGILKRLNDSVREGTMLRHVKEVSYCLECSHHPSRWAMFNQIYVHSNSKLPWYPSSFVLSLLIDHAAVSGSHKLIYLLSTVALAVVLQALDLTSTNLVTELLDQVVQTKD